MQTLTWVVENKELIKIFYASIIVLICAIITIKSDKIFKLSSYTGIRYFRNAFFFYGIAFSIRYLIKFDAILFNYYFLIKTFFEFFLIMAGFFLLYSLLWKKIESNHEDYSSSLFNAKVSIFYTMTFLIVLLDYLWSSYYFMFVSQIILFSFAFAISFCNYIEKGKKGKFLKFYSIAMFLTLMAWMLNAFSGLWFNWHQGVLIAVYLLNTIMFLLFLIGIINVTKGR